MKLFFLRVAICILGIALACPVAAQEYEGKTLVKARLIAEVNSVQPGVPFRVGVLLEQAPGWHTYWKFPGDSGLPTTIKWTLPKGFSVGELQWPLPKAYEEDGELEVYVYKGEVMLFTTITPPKNVDGPVVIEAKVDWLVCEKICIPGEAALKLELPIGNGDAGAEGSIFEKYDRQLPASGPPAEPKWERTETSLILSFPTWQKIVAEAGEAFFFPNPPDGVVVAHPKTSITPEGVRFEIPITEGNPQSLPGVVRVGEESWELAAESPASASAATATSSTKPLTLLPALLFGFLGGLILNLMPCVLPVISLKMFSFVKQAGESRARIFRMGLAFSAGMFAWFMGLAVVLLILRSTGSEISWAQQFQNPWFNIGISVLIFMFALNLLGVYEITLPGSAATKLAGTGDGYGGAFFQGVFATILGTPCTAPYLGTTLAFALAQPPAALLAVFAAIALGMSSPYLLLCANPGWMRFLPKPGIWMVRLKEFMGFLLLATLLWFIWIVGRQLGINGVIFLGALLLLGGLGAWIYGVFLTPAARDGEKKFGAISLLIVLGLSTWLLVGFRPAKEELRVEEGFATRLEQALDTDQIVFVDFTADWCLSCKVNKRVAIDSASVQAAFREKNVLFLEGDWTNGDPEITAILKRYERAGVPLYLVYPKNRSSEALILPELLTPQIILDALEKS